MAPGYSNSIHGIHKSGTGDVEAEAPVAFGDTATNLKAAAEGENYEYSEMYPEFAKIAEEEGHKEIGDRLKAIAQAEKHHAKRTG